MVLMAIIKRNIHKGQVIVRWEGIPDRLGLPSLEVLLAIGLHVVGFNYFALAVGLLYAGVVSGGGRNGRNLVVGTGGFVTGYRCMANLSVAM